MMRALALASAALASPPPCTNDTGAAHASVSSCSFAGTCASDGACRCAAGFAGHDCAALDLAPHAAIAFGGPDHRYSRTHTWCGSVLRDVATGLWHGYFTATLRNCPVVYTFYQNAQVLHATARSALGPFVNARVALPNWASQPELHVDNSSGTPLYVLLHSRFASWAARSAGNATAFPCDVDGRIAPPPARDQAMERNVSLAFSRSPAGPWECCNDVSLGGVMKNPSLLIHRDGTAVLVWRAGGHAGGLTTARADGVRGRFRVVPTGAPADPYVVDPHLMWLEESRSYHVLGLGGAHYARRALDEPWVPVGHAAAGGLGPAFNGTVAFDGDTRTTYGTRECPKVVQAGGVGGAPRYLSSVVQPRSSSECGPCASSTVVQQIGAVEARTVPNG